MSRRVVITGLGCVTPLGADVAQVWDHLIAGQSGVSEITNFDATSFPVRIAAEVRGWSISEVGERPEDWQQHARQTRFAVGAALSAARSAGLTDSDDNAHRRGIFMGCGEIFPDFFCFAESIASSCDDGQVSRKKFQQAYTQRVAADSDLILEPGVAVSAIAGLLNLQGPSVNFTNACVSSSSAIGEAMEVIRRGDADLMVAGGAHSMIHPSGITGFHRLQTLSCRNHDPQSASRPFDRDRDGFVAGEGAAILILEELEHAQQRGADIWAELRGYGAAHDAYRITDLREDGRGVATCIQRALDDAHLAPEDIAYINAHGSSTVVNDSVETAAIKRALGRHAYNTAISSTKSMTGHLTTACGAVEAMFCALTVRNGVVPPTINCDSPAPDCDLDYVPNAARPLDCQHTLNNNLGFGGQNVALVISRFDG